jgi:hypothetical protein
VSLTLDFRGNQILVYLYLSEVRAQELAVKLRQRVHPGTVVAYLGRYAERGLRGALTRGLRRVKIIHEAVTPDRWLEALQLLPSLVPRMLLGRLREWVVRGLAEHLLGAADVVAVAVGEGSAAYQTLTRRLPEGVAALLGAMLLFIALANAAGYFLASAPGVETDPQGFERYYNVFMVEFVHARSFPLFAIMFGYGLVQLARRQEIAGATPGQVRRVLLRRNAWLFAFGIAHGMLLFSGDFLGVYGLIGMAFTLILLQRSDRVYRFAPWYIAVGGEPGAWRLALELTLRRAASDDGLNMRSRGWTMEPNVDLSRQWNRGMVRWHLELRLTALAGSTRYYEYYYGVPEEFATSERPAFRARCRG